MDGIAQDIMQGIQVGLQSRQQRQNELARQQEMQLRKEAEARRAMEDQQRYQAMFGENAVMGAGGVVDIIGSSKAKKLADDAKQLAGSNAFMSALKGDPLDESLKSDPNAVRGYAEGFSKKTDLDNKANQLAERLSNQLFVEQLRSDKAEAVARERGNSAAEIARIRSESAAESARIRSEAATEAAKLRKEAVDSRTKAMAEWNADRNNLLSELNDLRRQREERFSAPQAPLGVTYRDGLFWRGNTPLTAEQTAAHKKWLQSQTNTVQVLPEPSLSVPTNVSPVIAPPVVKSPSNIESLGVVKSIKPKLEPGVVEKDGLLWRGNIPLTADQTYQYRKWKSSQQTNQIPDINARPLGAPPAVIPTTRTNQIVLPSGLKVNVIQ